MGCYRRSNDDAWTSGASPQHGKCPAADPDPSHAAACGHTIDRSISDVHSGDHQRVGRSLESMRCDDEEGAMLYAAREIDELCETTPNQDSGLLLLRLRRTMMKYPRKSNLWESKFLSLKCSAAMIAVSQSKYNILGVTQCVSAWHRVGDLQKSEGRKALLTLMCRHCSKHSG